MNQLRPPNIEPSTIRFIVNRVYLRLGHYLCSILIPNKFKKPRGVLVKHSLLCRFLFGGMPDFIFYKIFNLNVFLRAKFDSKLKKRLLQVRNGPFPVYEQEATFESTGIVRISGEKIEAAEHFLTEIFGELEKIKTNKGSTVRLADFYFYPAHSSHIFFLEKISAKAMSDLVLFIEHSGIDDFLLNYYQSGYQICNVRAWKSQPFTDSGGFHFDNLPPGFIKIMAFIGDSETDYLLNHKNGAFAYKNREIGDVHLLTGYLPTAIIDTTNCEHRAGNIASGHTRKAIELTARPFHFSEQGRYLEPGFCAAHPVNPFRSKSPNAAKDIRLSGFIGFSRTN